jgi:hypothetical protein
MKPKIVPVIRYTRFRFGRVEHVRKHMRCSESLSDWCPQVMMLRTKVNIKSLHPVFVHH